MKRDILIFILLALGFVGGILQEARIRDLESRLIALEEVEAGRD